MKPALNWLMDDGVREVFATAEIGATHPILSGRPSHYLPLLSMEDTVYVAGPSGLVDVVKHKARTRVGAMLCRSVPSECSEGVDVRSRQARIRCRNECAALGDGDAIGGGCYARA